MKLSIVIVNYNVRYFLEQCLRSVYRALPGIEAEVFVVDNNSQDGSVAMLKREFPQVKLIANRDNPGFAKANNQAIRKAKGQYVLLLNPDTVVEEQTFLKALQFMDARPQSGALGIRMIDGKGRFLPESKRGLPTPWTAFYKIFGFSRLFPRSPRFARYYLGHLDPGENHQVEVLAGAFMLLRKAALDKVGLLDETFFMYGEDIDLSYRIIKAGYQNFYLADSHIIHYKGESTKKGSLNYVFIFYQAMVIFARKHFSQSYARLFQVFIYLAIYLRAGFSIINRLLSRLALPAIDAAVLFGGLWYIKEYWEHNHRFIQGGEYPPELVRIAFPLYILAWLAGIFLYGGYDPRPRASQLLKGLGMGTIAILVIYSLLPEHYRFSRAIILLGAGWALIALPLWRLAAGLVLSRPLLHNQQKTEKRRVVVGSEAEIERVSALIRKSAGGGFIGKVSVERPSGDEYLGNLQDLAAIIALFEIDEVIFCSADLSGSAIIQQMQKLSEPTLELKIAPPESQFIIGSNSINAQGDWYAVEFNAITRPGNRRAKLLLDFLSAFLLLIFSPLLFWFQHYRAGFFKNIFLVLSGKKTWVGYCGPPQAYDKLPVIPPAVLPPAKLPNHQQPGLYTAQKLNQLYAKDYSVNLDLLMIWQNFRALGQAG